jgi:phosphoglycolate phosphatase
VLGVKKYFSIVYGDEAFKWRKPHPYPVLKACQNMGIDPAKTLMVGDNYTDIEAGFYSGAITCFCSYGIGFLTGIQPNFKLNSPLDLARFFKVARHFCKPSAY